MIKQQSQGFVMKSAQSALHTDESLSSLFTAENHGANVCKVSRFTAKRHLPLSPCITVKCLNLLLQGQVLSAIWITVSQIQMTPSCPVTSNSL